MREGGRESEVGLTDEKDLWSIVVTWDTDIITQWSSEFISQESEELDRKEQSLCGVFLRWAALQYIKELECFE